MTTANLLVELFVEELPPKALKKLGEAFAQVLFKQLQEHGLASTDSVLTSFASPRRLAAHVTAVLAQAPDKPLVTKLMSRSAAFDAQDKPTQALVKKAAANPRCAAMVARWPDLGDGSDQLYLEGEGKAETLFFKSLATGMDVRGGVQRALLKAIDDLPIPKVMTYQLADGWTDVKFVRPVHRLLALHGSEVVNVSALGLQADNLTEGHRFESPEGAFAVRDADSYATQLRDQGAVIASFEARRAEIVRQLEAAAEKVGGGAKPIADEALLDEVTGLVERPNVLICEFEKEFLDVPQECLILTMKANQKYFPLLEASGKLTNQFLVVSNIRPDDASAVIQGNERVVRPRLADAKFFFDQDRKKTLESRVAGLAKVVYHNKLGTQAERSERVVRIATDIVGQLITRSMEQDGSGFVASLEDVAMAARLAKADLLTDMVGEFPELQGVMGNYYARHDGLSAGVAQAIEDHYRPRFAGDALPCNAVGVVVALADKLETLVGMFGIGQLPTGDRDPFALRRHALGVVRMLVECKVPLNLDELLADAAAAFGDRITEASLALADFIYERMAGSLREQGYSAQEIDSVLAQRPQRLGDVSQRLAAVRAFAILPEAPALAAANKRIGNILKKAEAGVDPHVSEVLLKEDAECALYAAMQKVVPQANAQFEAGDYTASLQTLAALRAPVDAFFDGVMVNADEADLRLNRLGLLATLHAAMNRVADLSRLAS